MTLKYWKIDTFVIRYLYYVAISKIQFRSMFQHGILTIFMGVIPDEALRAEQLALETRNMVCIILNGTDCPFGSDDLTSYIPPLGDNQTTSNSIHNDWFW